jgi:hypothetical protein
MTLKITKVETTLLRVPLDQRTITDSQSSVEAVEFLQVSLHTEGGPIGYGMNWSYTSGLRAAQVMVEDNYVPILVGAATGTAKRSASADSSKMLRRSAPMSSPTPTASKKTKTSAD